MEALTFRFVFGGQAHDLRLAPADLMRFQKKYRITYGAWAEALAADPGSVDMEQVLYLGWLVAFRTKVTTQEFDEWVDGVEFADTEAVTIGDPLESGNNGSSPLPPFPDLTHERSLTSISPGS